MDKAALLVGVSSCQMNLPPLQKARSNVEVLKRALESTNNGFKVDTLCDRPLPEMAETIERFFRQRGLDDQVLFLFSGYGIRDVDGELYFVAPETSVDEWGRLLRSRTLSASFLLDMVKSSPAGLQVIILDCCFRLTVETDPSESQFVIANCLNEMIGEGRVILTATTGIQYEPEPRSLDTWSYTRYLAEGAGTGAADEDCDGSLTVEELHEYARRKLAIAIPKQPPQIFAPDVTTQQMVLQVPKDEPEVKYRQFLEKLAQTEDEIDNTEFRILGGRNVMNNLRQHLGLSQADATQIEDEVLRPWREYYQRLQLYQDRVSTKMMRRSQDES